MNRKKLIYTIAILLIVTLLFIGISILKPSNNGSSLLGGSSVYAATLDDININMNSLMTEIETEMRTKPQVAMMGTPINIIKESQSYKNIVALGLRAVKPLYDKLYDSRDAGLYEYILSLAIEEITQEEFIYNATYGWKNSLEFRMSYEAKVNNVQTDVEMVINNEKLTDEEKTEKLKKEGIFAVSTLIEEYNSTDSKLSKKVIENVVQNIYSKYDINNDMSKLSTKNVETKDFINENKDLFDSLVDLNGRAYN